MYTRMSHHLLLLPTPRRLLMHWCCSGVTGRGTISASPARLAGEALEEMLARGRCGHWPPF